MTVAQDAEFLQQVDAGQLQDLHRSNLLRLGAEQLVESVAAARPPSKASELVGQIGDFFTRALPKKKVPLLPTTPFVSVGSSKQQPPETSSSLDGSDKLYLPRLTCVVPAFEDDINHTSSSNSLPSSGSGPNPSLSATSLLTKPSGNAHIPPSIELHVVLPDSFYSPKDYAKHRYFQVRLEKEVHTAVVNPGPCILPSSFQFATETEPRRLDVGPALGQGFGVA